MTDEEIQQELRRRLPKSEARSAKQRLARVLLYLGPPCWLLALGLGANRWLDTSVPQAHPTEFVAIKKAYKSPKTLLFKSWRKQGQIDHLFYDPSRTSGVEWDTPAGTPIIVFTKKGAFGWTWISHIRRDDRPDREQ